MQGLVGNSRSFNANHGARETQDEIRFTSRRVTDLQRIAEKILICRSHQECFELHSFAPLGVSKVRYSTEGPKIRIQFNAQLIRCVSVDIRVHGLTRYSWKRRFAIPEHTRKRRTRHRQQTESASFT